MITRSIVTGSLLALALTTGCAGTDEPEATLATTVETAPTNDSAVIMAQLGPDWSLVAPGVAERATDDGRRRVAFGPEGRRASLADARERLRGFEDRGVTGEPAVWQHAREVLRDQVDRLRALDAVASLTNYDNCGGDVYFGTVDFAADTKHPTVDVWSGRSYGFGPPVPWTAYGYAAVISGYWPIAAESETIDGGTAHATISTSRFTGCLLDGVGWVSWPSCPNHFLYVSDTVSCYP